MPAIDCRVWLGGARLHFLGGRKLFEQSSAHDDDQWRPGAPQRVGWQNVMSRAHSLTLAIDPPDSGTTPDPLLPPAKRLDAASGTCAALRQKQLHPAGDRMGEREGAVERPMAHRMSTGHEPLGDMRCAPI